MENKTVLVVIGVIFDKNGRVLITQRNDPEDPKSHNKWQLPGGGLEFGEHPKQTLTREIKEETGLTIKPLAENPLIYSEKASENVQFIFFVYPCLFSQGELDISGDDETNQAEWVETEEVTKRDCLSHTYQMVKDSSSYLKD